MALAMASTLAHSRWPAAASPASLCAVHQNGILLASRLALRRADGAKLLGDSVVFGLRRRRGMHGGLTRHSRGEKIAQCRPPWVAAARSFRPVIISGFARLGRRRSRRLRYQQKEKRRRDLGQRRDIRNGYSGRQATLGWRIKERIRENRSPGRAGGGKLGTTCCFYGPD